MTEKNKHDFSDVLNNISSFLCVIEDYNESIIEESDVILALNILKDSVEHIIKNSNETTEEKFEKQTTSG